MPTQPAPRARRPVVREVLLWAAAAVGALSLVAAIASLTLGITPVVFTSGSMSPAIPVGALALAQKVSSTEVVPGDVVSFIRSDGERLTHRVVEITTDAAGELTLRTKGDTNSDADPEPVVSPTVDRVFWSVPEVGFWIAESMEPTYTFPAGVLIGMIAVVGFRAPSSPRARPDDTTDSHGPAEPEETDEAAQPSGIARSCDTEPLVIAPRALGRVSARRARALTRIGRKRTIARATVVLASAVIAICASNAAPVITLAAFSDTGEGPASTFSAATSFTTLAALGAYPASAWVNYQDQTPACSTLISGSDRLVTVTWGYSVAVAPTHYIVSLTQRDGTFTRSQQVTTRSATFSLPLTPARYGLYDFEIVAENGSASSSAAYLELDNQDEFYAGCHFPEPQPVVAGTATTPDCTGAPDTETYRDVTFTWLPAGGTTATRYDVTVSGLNGFTTQKSSTTNSVTIRVPLPSTGDTTYGNLPVLIQAIDLNAEKDKYAAASIKVILQFESYTDCYLA